MGLSQQKNNDTWVDAVTRTKIFQTLQLINAVRQQWKLIKFNDEGNFSMEVPEGFLNFSRIPYFLRELEIFSTLSKVRDSRDIKLIFLGNVPSGKQ